MISTSATPGASVRRATLGDDVEAPRPRRSGIDHELAASTMHERAVRMAEHQDARVRVAVEQAFRRGADKLVTVADVNLPAFERQPAVRFEFRGIDIVHVAVHGQDRCQRLELDEDVAIADIAGMQNQLDAFESVHR